MSELVNGALPYNTTNSYCINLFLGPPKKLILVRVNFCPDIKCSYMLELVIGALPYDTTNL
jgi:hypothetical protein